MIKFVRTTLAAALLAVGLLSANSAVAVPIAVGSNLDFSLGAGNITMSGGTTTFNFTHSFQANGTGDFSGIVNTPTTFSKFSYTGPGSAPVLQSAPVNLFTVKGFSFALDSLTNVTITTGSPHTFSVLGMGTFTGNGFSPTEATFTLSGSGPGKGLKFTVESGTSTTSSAPDGGTTAVLLGSALLGLALLRHRLGATII